MVSRANIRSRQARIRDEKRAGLAIPASREPPTQFPIGRGPQARIRGFHRKFRAQVERKGNPQDVINMSGMNNEGFDSLLTRDYVYTNLR